MKRILSGLLALLTLLSLSPAARAEELAVSSESCILMEKTTGQVLYAVNDFRMVVYALVLILMMIFKPSGLMGGYDFSLSRILEKLGIGIRTNGKEGEGK